MYSGIKSGSKESGDRIEDEAADVDNEHDRGRDAHQHLNVDVHRRSRDGDRSGWRSGLVPRFADARCQLRCVLLVERLHNLLGDSGKQLVEAPARTRQRIDPVGLQNAAEAQPQHEPDDLPAFQGAPG